MLHAHAIHLKGHVIRTWVARITCYPPRNTTVHGHAIRVQVHVIHVHHTYYVTSHVIRVIITYYVWWARITCDCHVIRVANTYYVYSACITWCTTRYRSSGPKTRITCVLTCFTCGAELLMYIIYNTGPKIEELAGTFCHTFLKRIRKSEHAKKRAFPCIFTPWNWK